MQQLNEILARVLNVPAQSITDATSPANVPSWDSFNGLLLVSELEQTFKVEFTMDEITSVRNVQDIKTALRRHGIELIP